MKNLAYNPFIHRPLILGLCLIQFVFASVSGADTTLIIQENETGMLSFEGKVDTKHAGYTGTGFIDTENMTGTGITWEVCIPETGVYMLEWRYAHGKPDDRVASVLVDGIVKVDTVSFPPTGDFAVWDTTSSVEVTLESGPHQIRLEALTAEGLANTDYIAITGNNPKAGFCPVMVTGVSISPDTATVGVKGFEQLSASVLPANATNKNVSWSSSDTSIVTVSSAGLVKGVKEGPAEIIVTTDDGSFTDTCVITAVTLPLYYLETSVSGLGSVDPASDSIAEGSKVCLTAVPSSGWLFESWSGDTSATDNPVCIEIDSNISITAIFTEVPVAEIIPDGYAGYMGTTGGGSSAPVTVETPAQFISAVSGSSPAVVIVKGLLNVGTVTIGSNKTIVGFDSNSGLSGGTIKVQGSNYIFKNLTFGPYSGGDVCEVSGATKVFITKCSFHDAGDEILSIVRQADWVTVSWCKFYFDNTHSHAFGHLIGNSDGATGDRGKLHVTMHHNWYAQGIRGRQPRVRYGHVHIYNNYYNSVGSGYCIGVGYECHIRVENTFFEGVSNPWADYGGVSNGQMAWNNLKFVSCSQPTFVKNSFPPFNIPYSYVLDPIEDVKEIVKAGAGNVFDTLDAINPIQVSIPAPSDNDNFEYNSTITVEADASVTKGTIESVQFWQNDKFIGADTTSPFSIKWENVSGGTYRITAKAVDEEGISTFSDFITITVEGNVHVSDQENVAMNLYPNPVTNDLIIQMTTDLFENALITLYDSQGKSILNEIVKGKEHRMDLSDLPEGVYIISLTTDQGNIVRRLVKN